MKKLLAAAVCSCVVMFSSAMAIRSYAVTTTCDTYSGSNVESQDYNRWSDTVKSYLTKSSSGGLMRVQGDAVSGKILVEYYDSSYNILSSQTVSAELPIFGAFYETDSNYYILSGQTNYNENDSVEVYRITKYDKNWKRISSCGLKGANTYIPFDAGSARIVEDGKYLLIRTCHEMYASDDGLHHQANVTIQVDTSTMTITDSYSGVMNSSYGYISHSFNQFIQTENGHIIAVDHGDAYPRSIALVKYATDYTTGKFTPTWGSFCTVYNMLTFPGKTGENATGASVGGFEISSSAYIVAGNYTGDDKYSSSSATRNIFVATLAKNSETPVYTQITNYTSGTATTPHLVKLATDSYMLMWSYNGKVYYTKLDKNGKTTGSTYSMTGSLSGCVPLVYNGKLVWYTWKNETVTFYSINISSPSSNSKTVIENGHRFTTKNTAGSNVATQTCSQCGLVQKITVPTSFNMWWRENASSGSYWSSCSSTYHPGDTLDVWADVTNTNIDNYDMVIEISDTSVVSPSKSDYSGMTKLTMNKPGTFTLKVYPRFNTSVVKTYSFTVAHKYTSKVTKAATCTATGVRTYTCSVCGDSYTETIAKTAHTYSTEWTIDKAATCSAEGSKSHHCTACGAKGDVTSIAKTAHKYTSKVTKAATCYETGIRTYTCSACGDSYTETIAKLTHSYTSKVTKAATCTETGKKTYTCSACGDSYNEILKATGHKYTSVTVAPTFSAQGYTQYTCSVCGDSYKDNYTAQKTLSQVKASTEYTCTSSAIRVNWSKVSGAAGYIVERSTDGESWVRVARIADANAVDYKDSDDLKSGTKYFYRIKAFVTENTIAYYSPYSAVITAYTKPATPVTKTDYTNTSTAIRINWNKVEGASGYKIFRYNESTKAYELLGKVNNNTTFNYLDSNCTAGTTYKYQVQAFTNTGSSYLYSAVSSTITAATKPAATTITKNTQATSAVRLYWNKVSCTGYKIQQYIDGEWVTIKKVAMDVTEYRVEGLKANTSYKFRIQAYYTVEGNILYGAVSGTYTAKTAK